MAKPTINEETLNGDYRQATVWQEVDDGVPEQALSIRTYDGGNNKPLVEIRQGEHEILINGETVEALGKLLRSMVR
jgi:hypothetical protein